MDWNLARRWFGFLFYSIPCGVLTEVSWLDRLGGIIVIAGAQAHSMSETDDLPSRDHVRIAPPPPHYHPNHPNHPNNPATSAVSVAPERRRIGTIGLV